jgi:thiamine-phosphate pyrophosphorylase
VRDREPDDAAADDDDVHALNVDPVRLYLCAPAVGRGVLEAAVAGGVDVVQLRDHALDDDGLKRAAGAFRGLGVPFILNDRPDLVEAVGADGVHLGQDDGDPPDGFRGLVGRSTHAPEQAERAEGDYLSVGPVWATPTKPGRPAAGLDYVRWAAAHVDKPWFAIGGIDAGNVHEVLDAGATRLVVVRAILDASDPEAAAHDLREALDG